MKKLALITSLFIAVYFMSSCSNTSKTPATSAQQTKGTYYTCEMDPEVHSDKPVECPKCGMKLMRNDSIKK